MNKTDVIITLVLISFFILIGTEMYFSFEKKEICIIEGMAQHYSASDIQNICKF